MANHSNMDNRIRNLNQMEDENQRRNEAYNRMTGANINDPLNYNAEREQAQRQFDHMAQDVHDWGNTITDRQEPQPLHIMLEEWLMGHPILLKYVNSKMDMDMSVGDRLPMAILGILWIARKQERTTGNQVIDKMNRELEVAVKNKGG